MWNLGSTFFWANVGISHKDHVCEHSSDCDSMCLCSAQRAAGMARSLTEDMEEARRALRDAQERVAHAQTSYTKLVHKQMGSRPNRETLTKRCRHELTCHLLPICFLEQRSWIFEKSHKNA